jgi:hypothetical protein
MVKINNVKLTKDKLTFSYEIRNNFLQDIWICNGIDIYHHPNAATLIERETLFIDLRFNLPCNIDNFEEAVIARYVRLGPGKTRIDEISLDLPISNSSPLYHFDKSSVEHLDYIQHIVCNIGFFKKDLFIMISEAIKKSEAIQGSLELDKVDEKVSDAYYTGLLLKDINGSLNSDVVHVPHFWTPMIEEEFMTTRIDHIKVPVLVHK